MPNNLDRQALVRMEIRGLVIDPATSAPVVLLRSQDNQYLLPIWIGPFEASAIQLALDGVPVPRPMTHDLMASLFQPLGGKVEEVIISDMQESTFYAQVVILHEADRFLLDCRPSDALALATRLKVPIFAATDVLQQAGAFDADQGQEENPPIGLTEDDDVSANLEDLSPEDFGKYTM